MSANYDSDDAFPRSPGLSPVRPRATPSPSPPPIVTRHRPICTTPQNVSTPSSRRQRKSNRRKTRPSQGDFVLIRVMDPNQPDIARQVGERALNSESESDMDDDEMENSSPILGPVAIKTTSTQVMTPEEPSLSLSSVAQKALDASTQQHIFAKPPAPPLHRDSVVDPDGQDVSNFRSAHSISQAAGAGLAAASDSINGHSSTLGVPSLSLEDRNGESTRSHSDASSSNRSPDINDLTISTREGSPSQKLPALQTPQSPPPDGLTNSPSQTKQQLPGFRHLSDLAETAIQEQETHRANSIAHRQSVSSSGQSPTSMSRQLSITSLSPNSAYPHSATSPGSGPEFNRDPFMRTGQLLTHFSTRRPSQASDTGPFSATTVHSATTDNGYQSSEGVSPGAQVTPIDMRQRLSIDGALASRLLPLPVGPNIQHIPPHGSGGFKCDHPGCTALPFQTQYLLNSHANVHSQSRPHYCPVSGCPRAEGGKGFKRKNEMIRHGLVHASPGYVCPFCPDREHKYPRPDNLQRHVRVHHVDKDKDDPQLRDVLAQRPEGGSRGRRRRISS